MFTGKKNLGCSFTQDYVCVISGRHACTFLFLHCRHFLVWNIQSQNSVQNKEETSTLLPSFRKRTKCFVPIFYFTLKLQRHMTVCSFYCSLSNSLWLVINIWVQYIYFTIFCICDTKTTYLNSNLTTKYYSAQSGMAWTWIIFFVIGKRVATTNWVFREIRQMKTWRTIVSLTS